jgi:hypothetical protein
VNSSSVPSQILGIDIGSGREDPRWWFDGSQRYLILGLFGHWRFEDQGDLTFHSRQRVVAVPSATSGLDIWIPLGDFWR